MAPQTFSEGWPKVEANDLLEFSCSDWIEIMTFNPPAKKPRGYLGNRTINSALLDVRGAASFLGVTEKTLRARVARHQVPFRVWGGRVVFVRA